MPRDTNKYTDAAYTADGAVTFKPNQGGHDTLSGKYVWWFDATNTAHRMGAI